MSPEVGLYSILRHADWPILLLPPVFLRTVEIRAFLIVFFFSFFFLLLFVVRVEDAKGKCAYLTL